jgi:hypothetical protein
MTRIWLLALLAATLARPAVAQTVRFGVQGVGVSYAEVSEAGSYIGAGGGGFVAVRFGRFLVELDGYRAKMELDDEGEGEYDILEGNTRIAVALARGVALQVGGTTRKIDPEFAAQDAGFVRVGVMSENQLSNIAALWVRGAYLVGARFNGGGNAPFAFEVGLGTALTTSNRRFGVRVEFDFQRIDRQVFDPGINDDVSQPIQALVAKIGLQVGL